MIKTNFFELWQRHRSWVFLWVAAALLYTVMLSAGNPLWGVPDYLSHCLGASPFRREVLFLALYAVTILAFALSTYSDWVLLATFFLPLEFSLPFGHFPKFSPVGYLSATALIALLTRSRWLNLFRQIRKIFGIRVLLLWGGFLTYGAIVALIHGGDVRFTFRWGTFLLWYFIAAMAAQDAGDRFHRRLAFELTILAISISLYGIAQYIQSKSFIYVYGLFLQHNNFATFLSLCLPACSIYLTTSPIKWTSAKEVLFLIGLAGFVLAYSRGAWVGLGVGTLIVWSLLYHNCRALFPLSRKRLLIRSFFCLVLFYIVISGRTERGLVSSSFRMRYFNVGTHVIAEHPILGLKSGNFEQEISRYVPPKIQAEHYLFWSDMHNLYLHVLVVYGIAGFLLWGGGLLGLVYKAFSAFQVSHIDAESVQPYFLMSIIAFLVHGLVSVLSVASLENLFGVLLAAVTYSGINTRDSGGTVRDISEHIRA
jgi:O-antigen ligase